MEFFSSVPLVDPKDCPDNEDHNRLARQVNNRLTRSGPDCLWRVFYYADSIFTGMRNTATPGRPLGVNPPEDEWWKIYMAIEYPVAATGTGNWPLTPAGMPQGANVMNPLNAYIFGRKTAENKFLEKQGPWAEGNLFDDLVSSSRAVLSNKQYWEDSFKQRGAIARNLQFNPADTTPWEGYSVFGAGRRIEAKYLPNPEDAVFLSTSLTAAAVSSDRYFQEYASQHVYMRYPPAIQGGKFIKYMQAKNAPDGVLKRKNAAKDLLQWALWCYVYHFRGSESQRSLFCSKKEWSTKVIDYFTTEEHKKSLKIQPEDKQGPLNICRVGFDFFKYFTRQNVFAPALGVPTQFKATDAMVAHKGYYELDDLGNMRVEPYRVSFARSIAHRSDKGDEGSLAFCTRSGLSPAVLINYDNLAVGDGFSETSPYGKTLKFEKNEALTLSCDYDSYKSSRQGRDYLNFNEISGKGKSNHIKSCIAGYYIETNAIENPSLEFKFRIKSDNKIVHETIIAGKYSYKVNRNGVGDPAYIYNKMFYFKEGLVPSGSGNFKFEIVPVVSDLRSESGEKIISLGDPWSSTVASTHVLNVSGTNVVQHNSETSERSHIIDATLASQFSTGDMVRVKSLRKKESQNNQLEDITTHLESGNVLFIRKEGNKLYFSKRQDDRLLIGTTDDKTIAISTGFANIYNDLVHDPTDKYKNERIIVEKLTPPTNVLKVKVDLAILQKRKPTFQDAYALLRVTTAKQNRRNPTSSIIFNDAPGVGTVGHHFSEANRVFRNYFKYGSAMNIYGSSAVPALRMYVSANPIYESMRKFISKFMRFADRQQLVNYTVEGGKGVLYFKRFAWGLARKYKATILRNMEPSIDPAGWFVEDDKNVDNPGHSAYTPIREGKSYRVACNSGGSVTYNGQSYGNNQTFEGVADKDYLDANNTADPKTQGAFEEDGISLANGNTGDNLKYVTNDWIMFMTSSHYHWANSNIYKPSVYNDIMGFLNNRCHHRSKEYENSYGDKYDMIRSELLRTPTSPRNTPGQLQIFLSKSSPNFNYVFNTNDPEQGNVELYSETGDGRSDYLKSCPAVSRRPYRVTSTKIVNSRGGIGGFNPSSVKIDGRPVFDIVKVTLNKPLKGTGRLSVDSRGWVGVSPSQLKKEPYRTDENAVIEYLHHSLAGYGCKRNMIGDYGADSEVIEGDGYRPFGACYPRFYFLKLIPRVPNGALLDSEPYAQMDFYFRAMSGAFLNPFSVTTLQPKTNWKFGEIASRSSEEDPTMFDYIDPREIQS
jgi:hypothetical protein